jgi:hypothetical protein
MTNPTADEARLREIAERAEKATVGPWKVQGLGPEVQRLGAYVYSPYLGSVCSCPKESDLFSGHTYNMEFIAHARSDIPWLLDQLTAALARAEAEREKWQEREAVYRSQIEAGAKRIEAAEKALEPFARIAPAVEVTDKRDGNCVHRQFFDGRYYELTKDDFRRAARALSAGGGQ